MNVNHGPLKVADDLLVLKTVVKLDTLTLRAAVEVGEVGLVGDRADDVEGAVGGHRVDQVMNALVREEAAEEDHRAVVLRFLAHLELLEVHAAIDHVNRLRAAAGSIVAAYSEIGRWPSIQRDWSIW